MTISLCVKRGINLKGSGKQAAKMKKQRRCSRVGGGGLCVGAKGMERTQQCPGGRQN